MEPDLLNEFLIEAQEHLRTVEEDVLVLERGGKEVDSATVNRLFRSVHTVKGGAAFLDLVKVKDLAHALENVVGAIRSAALTPDQRTTEVLLDGADRLRYLLDHIDDASALIEEQVAACTRLLGCGAEKPAVPVDVARAPPHCFDFGRYDFSTHIKQHHYLHVGTIDLLAECGPKKRDPDVIVADMRLIGSLLDTVPSIGENFQMTPDDGGHCWFSFVLASIIDDKELLTSGLDIAPARHDLYQPVELHALAAKFPASPPVTPPARTSPPSENGDAAAPAAARGQETAAPTDRQLRQSSGGASTPGSDQTVRITLSLIDNLMNLASELVLVRNQYLRSIATGDMARLTAIGQRLNVVTSEIQTSIMQTRMRPVGTIFNRFSRVVRDLARQLGKKANLEINGAEVELDKSIIDAIGDPMTHLVRNAVDHGIEMPEVREKSGKPAEGTIRLSAFHRAGQVIIQIDDDGKGMDPRYILSKAVEKGLVAEELSHVMSEREIFDLIFVPGFSTAEKVTEISGRGVGMDVVRSGIQTLGGTISISSAPGRGSTIRIELPLTLAIIPALIVGVESNCFAIPQVNIVEVVWLHGSDVFQSINKVDDREVYWLRGALLPLLRLSETLKITRTFKDPVSGVCVVDRRLPCPDRRQDDKGIVRADERRTGPIERRLDLSNSLHIVVLRVGGERFGLVVDSVIDTEEIVVKSLHDQLKGCRAYAGTAVLGNGKVAMILDIMAVAELGSLQLSNTENRLRTVKGSFDDRQTVLQFSLGGPERFAVPLCLITRVQELRSDQVKHAHGRDFLIYRDRMVPLIHIDQAVPEFTGNYSGEGLSVIIPKSQNLFGVVVAGIIDTVEVATTLDTATIRSPCIIGMQLLQGEPTLFIDLLQVIDCIDPDWNGRRELNASVRPHFLVVDDSAFYQQLLGSFLRASGATVHAVSDGQAALQALATERFNAVICDIEMPVLDGFGFIRAVREGKIAPGVPMLAVSTAEESYMRPRALDSGFDEFKPKGNLEQLLGAVNKLLCAGTIAAKPERSGKQGGRD